MAAQSDAERLMQTGGKKEETKIIYWSLLFHAALFASPLLISYLF